MSMTQEIVARIGADTSGFRKGVDEVTQQSASLKNNMRVAFESGAQGSRQLREAMKGVADMAGTVPGPLGQITSGVQSLFNAFKANPILGIASTIATGVTLIAKQIENTAIEAGKRIDEMISRNKRNRDMLRLLAPEKYDIVFKAKDAAEKMVTSDDRAGAEKRLAEVEAVRQQMIAEEEKYGQILRQNPHEIGRLRKEQLKYSRVDMYGGINQTPEDKIKYAELGAQIAEKEKELKQAQSMTSADANDQRKHNAEMINEQIAAFKNAIEAIDNERKRKTEQASKEFDQKQKERAAKQEAYDREFDSLKEKRSELSRQKELKDAEKQGKDVLTARRYQIYQELNMLDKAQSIGEDDAPQDVKYQRYMARRQELENELADLDIQDKKKLEQKTITEERGKNQVVRSSRDLALTREELAGRDPNILRRQFIQQDLMQAQNALRFAPMRERDSARAKIQQLTEELLRVNKEIRDKTGKGSRA